MNLQMKVTGCLVGGAIGNAMGHNVENWDYTKIREKYGRITSIEDPQAVNTEDDTKFVLWLCKAYERKQGRITPEDLAQVWLEDMDPIEMMWLRNVYELLKRGYSPRITGCMNINHGAAIMSVSPVGIFNACDPDNAYIDALDLGYLQQPEQDTVCSAVMAACFANAMRPDASVKSIIEMALSKAPRTPYHAFDTKGMTNNIHDFIVNALEVSEKHRGDLLYEKLYEKCLMWQNWDPMEVLALTLAVLNSSRGDTREAILLAANLGRDADTIANLVGGLAGALNGINSVPDEWRKQLPEDAQDRLAGVSQAMHDLVVARVDESKRQIALIDEMVSMPCAVLENSRVCDL